MTDATKPVRHIADVPLMERGHGENFAVKWGRMGPQIGADFTTATYKGMGRIQPAQYWDGEA